MESETHISLAMLPQELLVWSRITSAQVSNHHLVFTTTVPLKLVMESGLSESKITRILMASEDERQMNLPF